MSLLSSLTGGSSASGSSNTQGHAQTQGQGNVSIDSLLVDITTSNNTHTLNQHLRSYGAKEAREMIFASALASGQDPLTVLDVRHNTLGYLYLL